MKRTLLFSALLAGGLLTAAPALAVDKTVKLTTAKAVGEPITLLVNYVYGGVTIDWGDGQTQACTTTEDQIGEIQGTVKGSVITITGGDNWNTLSCAGQKITAIDLSQAKTLGSLYAQNNELSTINLTGMTSLTDLNLANNLLESITFTNPSKPETDLKVMENYNVSGNLLTGDFVLRSTALQSANIGGNKYGKATLTSSSSKLDYLNVGDNELQGKLSLTYPVNLTSLVLQGNAITGLTMNKTKGLAQLQQLVATNNALEGELDLSKSTGLKDLLVSGNDLTVITLANPKTMKLNTYEASGNRLSFASLFATTNKPASLEWNTQRPFSLEGMEGFQHLTDGDRDGYYMNLCPSYADRSKADYKLSVADLCDNMQGTTEVRPTGVRVIAQVDGQEVELAKGGASDPKDYTLVSNNMAFYTPQAKVCIELASYSQKDAEGNALKVRTEWFSVGQENVPTGISELLPEQASEAVQVVAQQGRVLMASARAQKVSIYAADGKLVWRGLVGAQGVSVQLPAGIYVAGGVKVAL